MKSREQEWRSKLCAK